MGSHRVCFSPLTQPVQSQKSVENIRFKHAVGMVSGNRKNLFVSDPDSTR